MILVRHVVGDVMRDYRLKRGMTLRDVSGGANVALGYLSELERGQKEASSEVLQSIANALYVPLSQLLVEVGDRLALFEEIDSSVKIPGAIPEYFYVKGEN
jgi:transcriptional regulator with XRE-family HTH domain